MLKENLAEIIQEPRVSNTFRASEVGECETFLCYSRLGYPALPLTGRVRHMLDDGLMHERDVVTRLRGVGFKIRHAYPEKQMLVRCYDRDGITVVGHPDGVVDTVGGPVALDYADEGFRWRSRYYGLEITAPGHFNFLRVERNHLRQELPRKFVQIQMYLNSEELRAYSDCMITIVKSKNTSTLYEEGTSLDHAIVAETVEKLKRVMDYTSCGRVSSHRCGDWRRYYCRYRGLCFDGSVEAVPLVTEGVLEGESLSEVTQLLEAEQLWLRGKSLESEAKGCIEEARTLFGDVIADYNAKGLTIGQIRALIVESSRRSVDLDVLRQRYPDIYDEVVEDKSSRYLRVARR